MAIVNLNPEEFARSTQGETPVLVEFWAPWCVYCRRIAPALEEIAAESGDALIVGKVNIDEAPQLAQREGIEAVPTFALYRNGQRMDVIVAPDSKAQLEAFLPEALRS